MEPANWPFVWSGFSILGMLIAFAGAVMAAKGVIISPEQADELAGTYWDKNLKLEAALLAQSRLARNGLIAVAVGTAVQAIGTAGPLLL